jgi:hypothetical protein
VLIAQVATLAAFKGHGIFSKHDDFALLQQL